MMLSGPTMHGDCCLTILFVISLPLCSALVCTEFTVCSFVFPDSLRPLVLVGMVVGEAERGILVWAKSTGIGVLYLLLVCDLGEVALSSKPQFSHL